MFEVSYWWNDGQTSGVGGDCETLKEAWKCLRYAAWKTTARWFFLNGIEVDLEDIIILPQ